MADAKKAPMATSQLQRPALTTIPQTGSLLSKLTGSVISSISALSPSKPQSGGGSDGGLIDPANRAVRKQANPVKQTIVVSAASSVVPTTTIPLATTTNMAPRITKLNAPPPPPLISAIPPQLAAMAVGGGGVGGSKQAAQPSVTANGTGSSEPAAKKSETAASSESSSDDSSSDSSATSGEESEKEKDGSLKAKLAATAPPIVDSEVPGPSGIARRGRGRPRLSTSTPKPVKQAKHATTKARSTPRKKSERPHKAPTIFSPDVATDKAALPRRRGRGCGSCPGCMMNDCGKCNYCKDKTKFGGPGRKKQRCAVRICSYFVKAVHPKPRPIQPATPPGEVAVIPVTKLASSLKVAEVIEQLRQNLTAAIPPVIDKDSLPSVPPALTSIFKPTSFIISQPQQLKTTPAAITAAETKIVGPVIPPTMIAKALPINQATPVSLPVTTAAVVTEVKKTPEPKKTEASKPAEPVKTADAGKPPEPTTKTPEPAKVAKTVENAKTTEPNKPSEIALRTRRKQQQVKEKEKEAPPTASAPSAPASGDDKVKCIVCGRERKPSLMRSAQFCTQRCINAWSEKNSKGAEPVSSSSSRRPTETPMEVEKQTPPQLKKLPRALKNLQIDMTWDKTTAVLKPTMTSTPTPTATTAANKRPTSSTGVQPTPGKKAAAKDNEVVVGAKRPSQQPTPQNQKKMKEADPVKFVSFNLTSIPTSTVDPISAPPLSRMVPPPSISIVPLDQLTALGTALLSQQQQRTRRDELPATTAKIPTSLPVDVRSWTIPQVVKFFESTSDCKHYASVFREQEVDGTALLLLTHESLVKCLGIKLGRALKIMVHVEELQKLYA